MCTVAGEVLQRIRNVVTSVTARVTCSNARYRIRTTRFTTIWVIARICSTNMFTFASLASEFITISSPSSKLFTLLTYRSSMVHACSRVFPLFLGHHLHFRAGTRNLSVPTAASHFFLWMWNISSSYGCTTECLLCYPRYHTSFADRDLYSFILSCVEYILILLAFHHLQSHPFFFTSPDWA